MVLARLMEFWMIILCVIFAPFFGIELLFMIPLILIVEIIIGAWDGIESGIWFNSIKEDRKRLINYFTSDDAISEAKDQNE